MYLYNSILPSVKSKLNYTQHNTTQHNTTQHNTTQHNTTHSNYKIEEKRQQDYLKMNYSINFRGNLKSKFLNDNKNSLYNLRCINHETRFFREPKTDKVVQDYILNNLSQNSEINVVSGACSSGEEAKSYAMMLDQLGDKLHIFGFDIYDDVISQAKSSTTRLIIDTNRQTSYNQGSDSSDINEQFSTNLSSEKFLTECDIENLTAYQRKCKEKFELYFDKSGETYQELLNPNAKKELHELQEKLKNGTKNWTTDERVRATTRYCELEKETEEYCKYQDYIEKEGSFRNCHFRQGDILYLEKMYKPNSVDVLLYRNALYHTLCQSNGLYRQMRNDSQEKMNNIARQMNKVVKMNGLVVFGENESQQLDTQIVKTSMENNGFKKLNQNANESDNIWVKIKEVN